MELNLLLVTNDDLTKKKIINNKYRVIKRIGKGQFGEVFCAEVIKDPEFFIYENQTGLFEYFSNYVAIKVVNRFIKNKLITKLYCDEMNKIKKEIQIMKNCNHLNIIKLYEVINDLRINKILLILEFCKFKEIKWETYNHFEEKYKKQNNNLKRLTLNNILRDITNGLDYLHNHIRVIHSDLKPQNLLVDSYNNVKISDFGVSIILDKNSNDTIELNKSIGSPAFNAPELCKISCNGNKDNVKINSKIDIWSLGVILFCLMFNDLPFSGSNEFELFQNIISVNYNFPNLNHKIKNHHSDIHELGFLEDLLKKILEKDPNKRISLIDIKNHDFTLFQLNSDEKKMFLSFNSKYYNNYNENIKKKSCSNSKLDIFLILFKKMKKKKMFVFNKKMPSYNSHCITNNAYKNYNNYLPMEDLVQSDDNDSFDNSFSDENDLVQSLTNNLAFNDNFLNHNNYDEINLL